MGGGIIVFIGEIQEKNGRKKLALDVTNAKQGKVRYIVKQNPLPHFDLVKRFERGDYKKDDYIEFSYNEAHYDNFPSIWKIYNLNSENRRFL